VEEQLRRRAVGAPAARSVLLTLLGEFVLPLPDGVWQEALVRALEINAYKEQAARQAIARSVSGGWLTSERVGRRARLRLEDATRRMLTEGAQRIYSFGNARAWDGQWLLVVVRVPEDRREVRHHLRTRLAWAGFGSLGGGLWISPHVDHEGDVDRTVLNSGVAEVLSFRVAQGGIREPRKVVAEAWDLEAIAGRYRAFIERYRRLRPRGSDAIFRAQTQMVHDWRKFPFLDPDLPDELLPARWPRSRAHDLFQARHAEWHEPAQRLFSEFGR
jgi:phenylacetic acid degradation operon negative regulatory protein